MVYKRLRNLRSRWNKSKIGSTVNRLTGNRYGRGIKQIATKGVPQMARDIYSLKKLLNVEKKRYDITAYGQFVGQINGTSNYQYTADVTPVPAQGSGYSQRNGASFKITSLYAKLQLYHQSATNAPMKIKIQLVLVRGAPQTASGVPISMYEYNSFVAANGGPNLVDYNSERNPDTFGQYKVLRTCVVRLQPDQLADQQIIKDFTIKHSFKKGHHIRFDKDTQTVKNGQLVLIVLADSGNISGSTAATSTYNIPIKAINTGAILHYDFKYYYVDN